MLPHPLEPVHPRLNLLRVIPALTISRWLHHSNFAVWASKIMDKKLCCVCWRAARHKSSWNSAEHLPVRRLPNPSVTAVPVQLLLPVPNGLRLVHPAEPVAVRGRDHKQVVEFFERRSRLAVVVGLSPTSKALP